MFKFKAWLFLIVSVISALSVSLSPVTAKAANIGTPYITAPTNGATMTNRRPNFDWTAAGSRVSYYRIQITKDTDSLFLTPVINATIYGTEFTPTTAMNWDSYRWRVRGENNSNRYGPWSGVSTLNIIPSLTATDEQTLNQNLETLSTTWDQSAVNSANAIISKPEYSASNWENYFETFFNTTNHPFTDSLRDYLGYPVYFWFDDTVHAKLQEGLTEPLWRKVNTLMSLHASNLGQAMDSDTGLRQSLFNSHRHFDALGVHGVVASAQETTYAKYKTLINQYPQYFKAGPIDAATQPYVPSLRAQVWMSFRDIKQPLDATTKNDIASTLGLTGRYLNVWDNFGTLLHDNNRFSVAQQDVIFNMMSSLPAGMLSLASITQNEMLGNTGSRHLSLHSSNGVNIFETEVGAVAENSFPSDIAPGYIDGFSVALAHELNHVIEVQYIDTDSLRSHRRNVLRTQAGSVDLQYLRSMVGGTFFQQYPQEFVASISNQWFADSKHTLDLGLQRFDQGYHEPLNQALFFADLYSKGGRTAASTRFYRIGTDGVINIEDVAVNRDYYGRIAELTYQGIKYNFTLDSEGNVESYSIQPI